MSFDPSYYALLEPVTSGLASLMLMLDPTDETDALLLHMYSESLATQHDQLFEEPVAGAMLDIGQSTAVLTHMPQLGEGSDSWSWH
ncbi:hypothetical protein [Thermomonas sp.]|jgi:hypothetical protein|uniref:hypothetical protein n=1 Tax=Thermomonas sp. TaxID=1971895 RepID=UPI00257EE52B|nr:hypothetical protein [Thermomonas sp.]